MVAVVLLGAHVQYCSITGSVASSVLQWVVKEQGTAFLPPK